MLDILKNRRSIRKFTQTKIPPEILLLLQEALLRAPTSKNNRPWDFIFVDDASLLQALATCKPHGASFLKDAPLAVVLAADESKSDVWVEDCAIAAITLQYLAQSMDIGSCWIQVRKRQHASGISAEKAVQQVLNLPAHMRVASIMALGYKAETRAGIPKEKLEFQKIKFNRYS
ncbi:MAG: nitroreductase family protein [Deltaproteobacteria bacterium]|nr:nitroreductase family protein [Deltaproteobacteria bacterium]